MQKPNWKRLGGQPVMSNAPVANPTLWLDYEMAEDWNSLSVEEQNQLIADITPEELEQSRQAMLAELHSTK